MEELGQWNNLDVTLNQVLADDDFGKKYFPFVTNYSMIISNPNLTISQTAHCDQSDHYSYKRGNTFNFSAIVGIKKNNFLDIKYLNQESVERVLIERGNNLFVRNDIPHRGCENLTDYEHHRIHCFCDPASLQDTNNGNLTVIGDTFKLPPYFDESTNKFMN